MSNLKVSRCAANTSPSRMHDVSARSRFIWHCAKTGRPLTGKTVNLYLPGGQRVRGYSDGSSVLFVESAFDTLMTPEVQLSLSPTATKWARKATLTSSLVEAMSGRPLTLEGMQIIAEAKLVIDILMAVGNQLVFGLETRADITADKETYDEVMCSTKLVLAEEFRAKDSFETLGPSHRTLRNG
ncbi:hypothetical protein [Marinobacter subterrani]|uniref:hypothetical protein n=1 Tax=Marinobacter subterrani TaxID=1658765 RepID=UPI0023561294|nr:hypothetical protein [Marinobacter subterrani]